MLILLIVMKCLGPLLLKFIGIWGRLICFRLWIWLWIRYCKIWLLVPIKLNLIIYRISKLSFKASITRPIGSNLLSRPNLAAKEWLFKKILIASYPKYKNRKLIYQNLLCWFWEVKTNPKAKPTKITNLQVPKIDRYTRSYINKSYQNYNEITST